MTAIILDGKKLAESLHEGMQSKLKSHDTRPHLAVILVGDDHASSLYVRHKTQACEKVGIQSSLIKLPETTSEEELLTTIHALNQDQSTHGILLQLPLPEQINAYNCLTSISPQKDVDGFHPLNLGRLFLGKPFLQPCTPLGVLRLIDEYKIPTEGQNAVIVGASNIVGKPMAHQLLQRKATVTLCHIATKDLASHIKNADIVVSAAGKANLIPGAWIKDKAAVFDIGMNRNAEDVLCGDINFAEASKKAKWITPVPGGVGPMTVAMLLENTIKAWETRF